MNKNIQRLHHPGTTMAKLAYVGRDANTQFFQVCHHLMAERWSPVWTSSFEM